MVAPRFLPASLSLLASGLVAAFAGTAQAGQSCALDSDCGHGFACKVVAESSCPGFACPEGQPCPEPPPCNATQIRECAPASCNAHSDCADGMVCYESGSVTTCPTEPATPTPACPPNADCFVPPTPPKPPSASECTTVTMRACTPRYQLPCANEASCGAGFNCVPDPDACECSDSSSRPAGDPGSSGSSSGSAGAAGVGGSPGAGVPAPTPQNGSGAPLPPSDPVEPPGGFAPPPNPVPTPECTCTASTTKHCEPKAVSCNADADCPATWTCVTTGGGSSGGCASGGRVLPDGGIEIITPVCDPAPPTTTVKQCMPPYYYGGGSKTGIDTPATGGGTTGNGSIPPRGTGPIGPGSPPTNPQPSTGGEVGNNVDPGDSDTSQGATADNSSCQMSVGHASTTSASLLALLGIAGMARRRRTRWG